MREIRLILGVMGILRRRGRVGMQEGVPVMVNEQDEAMRVDEVTILIWNACDGQNEEAVVAFFAAKVKSDREKVESAVREVIKELVGFGMLQEEF